MTDLESRPGLAARTARYLDALDPPWSMIVAEDPEALLIVHGPGDVVALWVDRKPPDVDLPGAVIHRPGDALRALESWGLVLDGVPAVRPQWSAEKRRALELVAQGCSVTVISDRLGRSRRTLSRWRLDPLYGRAWDRARN